jgi:hypothetical protein
MSSMRNRRVTFAAYGVPMHGLLRTAISHPGAFCSAMLWGVVEFVALWRSRWSRRINARRRRALGRADR